VLRTEAVVAGRASGRRRAGQRDLAHATSGCRWPTAPACCESGDVLPGALMTPSPGRVRARGYRGATWAWRGRVRSPGARVVPASERCDHWRHAVRPPAATQCRRQPAVVPRSAARVWASAFSGMAPTKWAGRRVRGRNKAFLAMIVPTGLGPALKPAGKSPQCPLVHPELEPLRVEAVPRPDPMALVLFVARVGSASRRDYGRQPLGGRGCRTI
jgi:hypothetical protein